MKRVEDPHLLTGRGQYVDDLPIPNLHHAAIVRSPHAHARIRGYDLAAALGMPGVTAALTGADVAARMRPFSVGVEAPVRYYCAATDRARFVGEPVAVVIARDRYLAEDAAERLVVRYEPLPAVVDPERALDADAPVLHDAVGSNLACHRRLVYGDPDRAFAEAEVVLAERFRYPKYSSTPIETYGVVARWDPFEQVLTVWSNFMGPFAMHALVARALGLAENRLRFIVAGDIGGSFGIKSSLYPYIALVGLAAMRAGVPVKWIETRREHLLASSSGTDRIAYRELAARRDGTILAMRCRWYDNVGGYIRSPEPGGTFRPVGNYVGPYRFQHLEVDAAVVMTNKAPTGPNRGYGCGHLYFETERMLDLLAEKLGLDPAEITVVDEMDTFTRVWSISSGTYSSRFGSVGTSAVALAARRLGAALVAHAARLLEVSPEALEFRDGAVRPRDGRGPSSSLQVLAGRAHWNSAAAAGGLEPGLQATAVFGFPQATAVDANDRINSSNTYGFIAEVIAVEVDPDTACVRILRYVSVHDAGTIINPAIAEGQIYGGALHGLGGALWEELQYDATGQCLTATLMDYPIPRATQAPRLDIVHLSSPSPLTLLGSKGLGQSSAMTVPAAIANAVRHALAPLGVRVTELPLTPARLWTLIEQARGRPPAPAPPDPGTSRRSPRPA